jgi:endo-1,4-beta-D-glucanase Y
MAHQKSRSPNRETFVIRQRIVPSRRFPPPWTAELTPNCFIVRDADGLQLAYVYYESEPGRRSAAKPLTKDEARRIAANIAKLPETLAEDSTRDSVGLLNDPGGLVRST